MIDEAVRREVFGPGLMIFCDRDLVPDWKKTARLRLVAIQRAFRDMQNWQWVHEYANERKRSRFRFWFR